MPHTSRILVAVAVTAAFTLRPIPAADRTPAAVEGSLAVAEVPRAGGAGREPCDDGATEATGPWGVLQAYHVYIAAPDFILQQFDVPSAVTRWTFMGMTRADVAVLFDESDIPGAVRNELRDQSRWVVNGDQIQVLPSAEALLALPPQARGRIYTALGKWEANEFQHSPYFVPCGDVRRWIGDTGLRPEIVDAVSRTAYPVGKALCFSDVALLVSMTRSHGEAREVLKALSRTRTAILRLRLDTASDVVKIRDYWSSGSANAKDFLPLLESVAGNPDVRHVDLVHVLPPYARKLCYTYPHPSLAVGGRYPDCHWTCLNFFNYRPEDRLFDTDGAAMFVQEHYDPGTEPYRFADVLFFTDPQGRAVHSCVYLAADFVYTKNGANIVNPWQIMRLQEVLDRYSVQGEPTVRIYRRRQ
jgi:hypothetical protein